MGVSGCRGAGLRIGGSGGLEGVEVLSSPPRHLPPPPCPAARPASAAPNSFLSPTTCSCARLLRRALRRPPFAGRPGGGGAPAQARLSAGGFMGMAQALPGGPGLWGC